MGRRPVPRGNVTSRRPARQSTVPTARPPRQPRRPLPPRRPEIARPVIPRPSPRKVVGRLLDDEDASLLDVLDNLLNKGVVLNADIVLALADVDLVYIRLAALLCAADRVLPRPSGK
jgi:gas vesicle structural protein